MQIVQTLPNVVHLPWMSSYLISDDTIVGLCYSQLNLMGYKLICNFFKIRVKIYFDPLCSANSNNFSSLYLLYLTYSLAHSVGSQ